MVVDEQTLIHSMGIALANNEYAKFFKKGSGLPQRKTWPNAFRTVKPLKQGQSGELIWIPIIQGENELADRNRLIKRVPIEASKIRRDLPAGSEVDITLKINESSTVWLEAYVPLLDDEFKFKIELAGRRIADPDFLETDFEAEMQRLREAKAKAAATGAETAERLVQEVEELPLLRKKIEQITRLYYEIVMAQPGWWVNQFHQMEKQQEKMSDQARALRLLGQGRDCLAKNNFTGLQNIVRQLWELLPKETVEEAKRAKRGYGADIIF